MATNLAIDPTLLDRAVQVSGERTKKAAVTKALQEFIARREQRRVAEECDDRTFAPIRLVARVQDFWCDGEIHCTHSRAVGRCAF